MIGKIKGIVDSSFDGYAIIDVVGVGYLVFCSSKTLANLQIGHSASLLIETHVREDHIRLYGFSNNEEKSSFNLLQSVKGVGTKMALTILSTLTPEEIKQALATKDVSAFSRVSGVGKKLAERIITELKDKYSSKNVMKTSFIDATPKKDIAMDAISALISLGINRIDAQNRIYLLLKENKNISLNELIKSALKKT